VPAPAQITLRDVGPRLRAALERESRRRGLSLNRTVLELLAEATGLADDQRRAALEHSDLDGLAGTWSTEEGRAFDDDLATQRQVDPKLWR
jgi:hypothetical protein